jgi:hypothetical protein
VSSAAPAGKLRPVQHMEEIGRVLPGIWDRLSHQAWVAKQCGASDRDYVRTYEAGIVLAERIRQRGGTPPPLIGRFLEMGAASIVAAIASFRVTQSIYRMDREICLALAASDNNPKVPYDLFERMPDYCVYIETPDVGAGMESAQKDGFYVMPTVTRPVDVDQVDAPRSDSLLVIASSGERIFGSKWAVFGVDESGAVCANRPVAEWPSPSGTRTGLYSLAINLASYVLSLGADVDADMARPLPGFRKNKRGKYVIPAPARPNVYEVGYRIGRHLAAARALGNGVGGEGRPVSPHMRRAHWHTFWTGPMSEPDKRKRELRWLPPIPVSLESADDLIPTIRAVNAAATRKGPEK